MKTFGKWLVGVSFVMSATSGAESPDFGPWPSQDGSLSFRLLPRRLSWWQGEQECQKLGLEQPTWRELSTSWNYLLGTSPINLRISQLTGCFSVCPTSIWTSDEKTADDAYEFSNSHPHSIDPRGAPKYWKYAAVCVERSEE